MSRNLKPLCPRARQALADAASEWNKVLNQEVPEDLKKLLDRL